MRELAGIPFEPEIVASASNKQTVIRYTPLGKLDSNTIEACTVTYPYISETDVEPTPGLCAAIIPWNCEYLCVQYYWVQSPCAHTLSQRRRSGKRNPP